MKAFIFTTITIAVFSSCSVQHKFSKIAEKQVLSEPALATAHIGISIFDADKQQYIYEHHGDRYFIPASNTKLLTWYAGMKHLGDSLPGLKAVEFDNEIQLLPTGDPTLLHPDFKRQPVLDFLRRLNTGSKGFRFADNAPKLNAWGSGWSWSDYDADYMAERSELPVYGNTVAFSGRSDSLRIYPRKFSANISDNYTQTGRYVNDVKRNLHSNNFEVYQYGKTNQTSNVPFQTSLKLSVDLLDDTLHFDRTKFTATDAPLTNGSSDDKPVYYTVHSQPVDSLFKPMMHRSDNFFAEQTLLMVSNELLNELNDAKVIDTLLKTDFADLPQKPKWVDGSGLSRYNLISPEDLVTVLNKANKEFDWKRITTILATGGEGTLASYYKQYAGKIYAKTGTLSNNIALSGFLLTNRGKKLIFSVLVNNHQAPTATIRKDVEKMLGWLIENY